MAGGQKMAGIRNVVERGRGGRRQYRLPIPPIYLPATAKNKDTGKHIVLTLKGQWHEIFKLFVFIEHMWARVE